MYESSFRNVLFPLHETIRGRKTAKYGDEYERSQWLPPEQLAALQWAKLQRLIDHSWNEVAYYRQRWREAGVDGPGDIRSLADYARLPVLTKQEVRDHFEAMKAASHRGRLLYKTTGGSTGEPLRIAYTRESYERRNAVMHRGYGWCGAPPGRRALHLWGEPPGSRTLKTRLYHAAFNRRMLNVFPMSDANMADYADAVDAYRPKVIVSYVASIVRLSEWLLAHGRRPRHAPQTILCAAEPLRQHQRDIIEAAFGCPVFNTYGCREFMLIASECEARDGLHVNADHLLVELGDTVAINQLGAMREVLVTDLHNYGMPLLRYANGDIATEKHGPCRCGRGLPMLASVEGRSMDALRNAQGHYVGEYLECLMSTMPGVKRFQAVQDRIDRIEVRVVPGAGFGQDAFEQVRAGMREAYGDGLNLDLRLIDDIPLTPTGKLRVAISKLSLTLTMLAEHALEWTTRLASWVPLPA